MKHRIRGVTLLELMVVIAIVAILAAVAYPSFLGQIRQSRRADAIQGLLSAQLKQEEWRVTHTSYTNDMSNLGNPSSDYYTFSASVSGSSYTLSASATSGTTQASDTGCTSFTINHQDTRTGCWQ